MSIVTSNANIRAPTQLPVEPFSDTTVEAFHEYLRTQPNRYWFTDQKYDLYKRFLLEAQGRDASHLLASSLPQLAGNARSRSRSRSPAQSIHVQKDNERRAKILALRDFCLNEDDRLCQKANPETSTSELIVLRDWQLYGVISNTHCGIPHGGQEKTFAKLSEEYYGIIRPEVRWLLKHCKVCSPCFIYFEILYLHNVQVCGLNRPNRTRPPLEPIVVSRLFERVQIDLIDM